MKYLEIKNGKCEGFRSPEYYFEAVEFAAEVKATCRLQKESEGEHLIGGKKVKAFSSTYKLDSDGTRFFIAHNEAEKLIKIQVLFKEEWAEWEDIYNK